MELGKRLDTAQFQQPFRAILDDLVEHGVHLYDSLRPHMKAPWDAQPFEITFADSPELNALTYRHNNAYSIRINRGAGLHKTPSHRRRLRLQFLFQQIDAIHSLLDRDIALHMNLNREHYTGAHLYRNHIQQSLDRRVRFNDPFDLSPQIGFGGTSDKQRFYSNRNE